MKEQEEKAPRLSAAQWVTITTALATLLGGGAMFQGVSSHGSAIDPAVAALRVQRDKDYEQLEKLKDTIYQMQVQEVKLSDRIKELEHAAGYDSSGDNPYYSQKRPR